MKPCICDQCELLYISSRNTGACATDRVGESESALSRAHTLKNMEYGQPYPLNHSAQPSVTGVRLSRCAMWLVAVLAEMPQSRALAAATARDTLRPQCCKIIYLNIRQWQLFVPPSSCSTCKQAPPSMSSCACLIHALIHTIKIHFFIFSQSVAFLSSGYWMTFESEICSGRRQKNEPAWFSLPPFQPRAPWAGSGGDFHLISYWSPLLNGVIYSQGDISGTD